MSAKNHKSRCENVSLISGVCRLLTSVLFLFSRNSLGSAITHAPEVTTPSTSNVTITNSPNLPLKWQIRRKDGVFFPVMNEKPEVPMSYRVSFSSQKPVAPPGGRLVVGSLLSIANYENRKQVAGSVNRPRRNTSGPSLPHRHRHQHGLGGRRGRRSSSSRRRNGTSLSSCTSVSAWVQLGEVSDMWGNTVHVLPYIEVGGRRTEQYIYETTCLNEGSVCTGTDNRHYTSECVNKKIYAYAYIRNQAGEQDWSLIEVNGSCNCMIKRKHRTGPMSLLEHLSDISHDVQPS